MCGKNSNTTYSSSTSQANPQAQAVYGNLLTQAGQVAATPYQAYQGQLVAPVNAQQTQGIGGINQYANAAQPAINQAMGYANAAAQPITGAQIQQYMSPYTQNVVNATQAQFSNQNAQQQSALQGNAIAQGALGGDRSAVAAANLAGQQQLAQAPVIAQLQNQGYQTAEQTALAEQQQQASAAYSLGNLGVAGQGAALQGAGAQIGAGTLQQQTQQAQLSAAYQQFLQQQAYPFQTLSWESGIDTGVGSQMGGTSQTTTTGPPPNPLTQIAGLGLLGAGIFGAAHGGAVHRTPGGLVGYDTGGTPYQGGIAWNPNQQPYAGATGYVPTSQITSGQGAPKPPSAASPSSQNAALSGLQGLAQAYKLGKGIYSAKSGSDSGGGGDDSGGDIGASSISTDMEDIDYAEGGTVKDILSSLGSMTTHPEEAPGAGGGVRGARGGVIGYDDGGDVQNFGDDSEWRAFRDSLAADPTSSVNAQPQGVVAPQLPPPQQVAGAQTGVADVGQPTAQPNAYADATKRFEGYAPVAKWDYKQYSNGYGTKAGAPGERIDQQTADSRFQDEYWKAQQFVNKVNPNLDPGSRWALTDLTYNTGTKWANDQLGQAVAAGDINKARQLITGYNHAGGQELPALTQRRMANASAMGTDQVPPGAEARDRTQTADDAGTGVYNRIINEPAKDRSGHGLFNMSDATKQGLMAAGLGMLGSRSPFLGVGIGEGGLQGLAAYRSEENKETSIDQAHSKLQMQAAKALQEHQQQTQKQSDLEQNRQDTLEERKFEHQKPFPVGMQPSTGLGPATPILGTPNPAWKPGSNEPKYLGADGKPIPPEVLNPALRAAPPQVPGTPQAAPPANPTAPPTAPAAPNTPVAGQQPYQVASAGKEIPIPQGMTFDGQAVTPASTSTPAMVKQEQQQSQSNYHPEVLQGLNENEQAFVKAVANYDEDPRGLYRNKNVDPIRLMGLVKRYRDDFKQGNYANYYKADLDWKNGKNATLVTGYNTVIQHMDTMRGLISALNNPSDIKTINYFRNKWQEETGSPAPTNLDAASRVVADELAKATVGTQTALGDRTEMANNFNRDRSAKAQIGVLNTYQSLAAGRLHSLKMQYEGATGKNDFDTKLTPAARKAFLGENNPADRFQQLIKEGKSKNEAYAIMHAEGL
jgi:GH24 family phage-related lysozyme (muramidase)